MKTFEEALRVVVDRSEAVTQANLWECKNAPFEVEEYRKLITGIAAELAWDITQATSPKDLAALFCATLQVMFEVGKQVGMEMERP